ncbi:MAG: valine--tRNA ligase [Deltaproteobacteria bacterium]|nr:valine--tRNA ligase [Deltaproteobacteria bacterium]
MNTTELSPTYDPTEAEDYWYPIWEKAGYFKPNLESNGEPYTIVIPPPNVTGSLHMGHALSYTLEDMLTRWRRMQGRQTLWLPGTDHAGIATQMVVERDLKEKKGKSRHDIGRHKFIDLVWDWKQAYGNRITKQLRVLGCSLDWSREHFTMDEQLSRAVREVFVRLYEEGLLYRAERLVNWCPRCHTALSDLEVEHDDEYQGELWSFAYPLFEDEGEIVVATTRPETMLGDTAVAVHPDDERYKSLIGKHLRHPLLGYKIPIIADAELVDPEFGTGAVKVTPAHDFNDFATGKRHNLDLFNIFDANAHILAEPDASANIKHQINYQAWAKFANKDRFAVRTQVKEALQKLGLERGTKAHVMPLGHCQRCETIVEPTLSVQWWVRTEPLAKPAIEAVQSGATRIIPENWAKTYYHWMENIQDWCVSRQLWWGHRIPAWYCLDCDNTRFDSDEPRFGAKANPIVAREQPNTCPRCGSARLVQDPDVLDTWFSSALWPFSTLGWPNNTKDLETFYPNSVMETGFDILFFWVARMMMMGCKFMGRPPFPMIYLHAMVRDKNGDKMSKTRGNVIDPLHLINGCNGEEVSKQFKKEYPDGFPAFGADALRFTLAALSQSGRDIKLSIERIDGYRAFANKIWNAARFALMRIDKTPKELSEIKDELMPADRFILSRLTSTAKTVDEALENYRFSDAAAAIYSFFWSEFCDWYIELIKARLIGDNQAEKDTAQATLVFILDNSLRLLHPIMPFITESIWQKLPLAKRTTESIMIAPYPNYNDLSAYANQAIEVEYQLVKNAIVGVRTIRSESNISPAKQLDAIFAVATTDNKVALEHHQKEITTLAKISQLSIVIGEPERPDQAAVKVYEDLQVIVPLKGVVDFADEAKRLQRSIDKTTAERDRIAKKLDNEGFLKNAPAEVVKKDRARVSELDEMIAKLEESLRRIKP